MRGLDQQSSSLFSYVNLEERIPATHPLRTIRNIVNAALGALDGEFTALYSTEGRPSIPPERLLRATLIQMLFSVRSERQLMESYAGILVTAPGIDQAAAGFCSTSMPSANLTPEISFGN